MRRFPACIAAAAMAAMAAPAASPAATIGVGTVADVVAADGTCSLREAVQAANVDAASGGCAAGAGADVIELPAGTYTLSAVSGSLGVLADVTLRGVGSGTVIQAQGTRILTIANLTPPSVTVEGITFRNGHAPDGASAPAANGTNGGAGQNGGSAMAQAGRDAGDGGAISNATSGTLTVLGCVFESNSAGDGGAGGQAQSGNGGPGTTVGGAASGGAGGAGGKGGAISTVGALVVRDSTFSGNAAGDGGAGGAAFGGTGGNASSVNANGGNGGFAGGGRGGAGGAGGAIHSASTVTIERSTFLANGSGTGGAGGAATAGAGGVAGSTTGTGGFGGAGIGGAGGFGANGGAVNAVGDVAIKSSTLRLNFAGAAGTGGAGTGGAGGDSPAPGATGGVGGQAVGGDGDNAGNGGAVRAGRLTLEASLIADTSGGLGGRGGDAVGGRGGNATNTSAEAQGGAGGAATGGNGRAGGLGALNSTLIALNSTIDGSTFGGGGRGGNATGGAGGTGEPVTNVGSGGSATGGRGGAAGVAGVAAGGTISTRSVTASGLATPGPAAGGTATSGGAGGAVSPGSAGAPGVGAFQALNSGSLTATLIVASGPKACDGPLTNGGFSLEFPRPGEAASCPATLVADPLLAAAGDFGGPTWTRPLGNAIGVDAVPAGAACPATDQRGVSRPRGSACDVGAYERAAPEATTGAAGAIGGRAATLHATVNPNGPAATVRFEYGRSTAYGAVTPDASVPVGLAGSAVAATAANLQPGTTYHYRVVAVTGDGTTVGADATFVTRGGGGGDTVAPVFRSASLQPAAFTVRRTGTRTGGARLSWRLSERARIVVTVARAAAGRRAGARCAAPTRRNRSARRCTRYVVVGRIAIGAAAQTGSSTFTGRLGRRSLRPGRHRATLVATDAAGNASAPKRLSFRIKR